MSEFNFRNKEIDEFVTENFEDLTEPIPRFKMSQSSDDVYIIYESWNQRFATRGLTLSFDTVKLIVLDVKANNVTNRSEN